MPAAAADPPTTSIAQSDADRQPWPIPRRRFELSTLLVSEFACVLLIAPFFLIFGHDTPFYSVPTPRAAIWHTATTQSAQAIELVFGILALLTLPFLSRRRRATWMVALGLAVLCIVLDLARQQGPFLLMLVGYPSVALLALVSLDALTGIRPAVAGSDRFKNLQLALGAVVTILWFLPTVMLVTSSTVDNIVSSRPTLWFHMLLAAAMFGAEAAGWIALVGYFWGYRRWLNVIGRLCGTLALSVTMAVGLWRAMRTSDLSTSDQQWLQPELLWFFMLISAALLLMWSGLTQKFILTAALERGDGT